MVGQVKITAVFNGGGVQRECDTKIQSVAAMRVLAEERRILALEVKLVEAELKVRRIDSIMQELNAQIAADEAKSEERRLLHVEIAMIEAQIAMKRVEKNMKDVAQQIQPERVEKIIQEVYSKPPPVPVRLVTTQQATQKKPSFQSVKPVPVRGKLASILNRFEKVIESNDSSKSGSFISNVVTNTTSKVGVGIPQWKQRLLQRKKQQQSAQSPAQQMVTASNSSKTFIDEVPDWKRKLVQLRNNKQEQFSKQLNQQNTHAKSDESFIAALKRPLRRITRSDSAPNDETSTLSKNNESFIAALKRPLRRTVRVEIVSNDDTLQAKTNNGTESALASEREIICEPAQVEKTALNNSTESTVGKTFEGQASDALSVYEEMEVDDEYSYMEETVASRHTSRLLDTGSLYDEESFYESIYDEETVVSYTYSLVERSRKNRKDDDDIESLKSELTELKDELSSLRQELIGSEMDGYDDDDQESIKTPTNLTIQTSVNRVNNFISSSSRSSSHRQLYSSSVGSGMNYSFSTINSDDYVEEIIESIRQEDDPAHLVETIVEQESESNYDYDEIELSESSEIDPNVIHEVKDRSSDESDSSNSFYDEFPVNERLPLETIFDESNSEEDKDHEEGMYVQEEYDNEIESFDYEMETGDNTDYGYEDHGPNHATAPDIDEDDDVGYEPQARRPTFRPMSSEDSEDKKDALAVIIKKGRLEAPNGQSSTPVCIDTLENAQDLDTKNDPHDSDEEREMEANRREMFRLAHKEQGFLGAVQEAASLGRLTRLKEHVVETSGTKAAPVRSRRASIVATNLLDIQWKTTHHGSVCNDIAELGAMFRGNEVITESSHQNKTKFPSSWDMDQTETETWDEFAEESESELFGGGSLGIENQKKKASPIEGVVRRVKEEDREKNTRVVQYLQNQCNEEIDLPEAKAPQAPSIIRRHQNDPRALRRCSIGTITRTLTHDVIQRHSERQARVDTGRLHMKGQCSCPYCYTASPFQTYAYKKVSERRLDGPPPGTWVRQNGQWFRTSSSA
eukprot:scaffold6861_cov148-Amphora_coffeaeformis.AAC.3